MSRRRPVDKTLTLAGEHLSNLDETDHMTDITLQPEHIAATDKPSNHSG